MASGIPSTVRIYRSECKPGKGCTPTEPITNPEERQRIIELLNETIDRIEKWKVWDTWWIHEIHVKTINDILITLKKLEDENKYTKDILNKIYKIFDILLNYIEDKFKEFWLNNVSKEVEGIINDLINGKSEILVSKTEKTLSARIYGKYIEIKVSKIYPNGSVVIQLLIRNLGGFYIDITDPFKELMDEEEYKKYDEEILTPIKNGLAATDEAKRIDDNKPAMSTTQLWQVLLWLSLYPGKVYVIVPIVNVNKNNVTVVWQLRAYDYKSLKSTALGYAVKLNDNAFVIFILAAVFGDGDVVIEQRNNGVKPMIRLKIGLTEFENWKPILNKLRAIGIKWGKSEGSDGVNITISTNYAIKLARLIINNLPPLMKAFLIF